MSINFCKFYNKTMNRLKDKHKVVGSVNIIIGMLQIIAVLCVILFSYITKPISMLFEYISAHSNISTKYNYSVYSYIAAIVSLGFISFLLVSVGYIVNNIFVWLILFPLIYISSIFTISCIICMVYTEEYGNELLTKYIEEPLIYLSSKSTSHCDLKNKEK